MSKTRMIHKAVKTLYLNRQEGDLLMDAPISTSWEDLIKQAEDVKQWRKAVRGIKDTICIKMSKGAKKRKHKMKKSKASADEMDRPGGDDEGKTPPKRGDKEESGDEDEDGWDRSKSKRVKWQKERKPIRCKDGFKMLVQASREHFCSPRGDTGPYHGVEVTYPNEREALLLPYTHTQETWGTAPAIYANVPARVINAVIKKHGGLTYDSGKLPPMIEVDEEGYQWAAAAEMPSDLSEDSEDTAREERHGSPSSMIQLGAPPPRPPPIPPADHPGALTPPQSLQEAVLSPIAKNQENDEDF